MTRATGEGAARVPAGTRSAAPAGTRSALSIFPLKLIQPSSFHYSQAFFFVAIDMPKARSSPERRREGSAAAPMDMAERGTRRMETFFPDGQVCRVFPLHKSSNNVIRSLPPRPKGARKGAHRGASSRFPQPAGCVRHYSGREEFRDNRQPPSAGAPRRLLGLEAQDAEAVNHPCTTRSRG